MNINKPRSATSVAKSVQSVSFRHRIRDFDFANPDFSWLPQDLQDIDHLHLTKMEQEILEGIIYQRNISNYLAIGPNMILTGFYKFSLSSAALGVFLFIFLMVSYYINVNYNLGFKFLTDMFA